MILKFKTNPNKYGVKYTLYIDTINKAYKRDYNSSWDYSDYITIGKRDREKLINQLEVEGYTQFK